MKRMILLFAVLLNFIFVSAEEQLFLGSPSKNIEADIEVEPQNVKVHLRVSGNEIIEVRTLKFKLNNKWIDWNWRIKNRVIHSINQTWKPVCGENSLITDKYNELILTLQSEENQKNMILTVRLYDEGIAFRYAFDKLDFWNSTLTAENTQFLFNKDCPTWVTKMAQGLHSETTLTALNDTCDRPQIVQVDEDKFVAIGEAALVDYSRMKLGKSEEGIGLQSYLSGDVNLDFADYQSPWRYVMIAGHPGKLVQNNYFILNLNEPNQIANTSWIRPGRVIREVTLITGGALSTIDFAAKHHIEYVEFDAGWYGPEEDEKSDATTVTIDSRRSTGPLDLQKVIEYATLKGVGIIVYVNQRALHNQLDEILPLYKAWGVKGVKYGFVDVGDQYATAWLHHAVRKAAKYELMVDIHDEYRPTGYSRTYPNLITQEGIHGDEESPSLEQILYTFYNRMICGAGDQTNCYFAERVTETMGGRAAQLAKLVTIYSPWQFIYWYDRPEKTSMYIAGGGSIIKEDVITDFYTSIPVVWDETKFVEGEMGKYSVIARRSASDWYVAVLNAGPSRELALPLDMLQSSDDYEAVLYYQASDKGTDKVNIRKISLRNLSSVLVEVKGNSGCVLHIIKKK